MEKRIILVISLLGIFILSIGVYLLFFSSSMKTCNDGTLYAQCSKIQPYYCFMGDLVEMASVCGCSNFSVVEGNKCLSQYKEGGKIVTLNYVLRGEEGKIDFIVYEKLYNYLADIPRFVDFQENFTLLDFRLRMLDDENQRELLLPLVAEIQDITKNKEDQARIAISLVQNIPFGGSDKIVRFGNIVSEYQRYPYEVLYDNEGVCGEKSELMIFLLREIGYGAAFLYYSGENHEAVGIKCPKEYGVDDSEFCFVETTGPSIITDDKTEYITFSELKSYPQVLIASNDGLAFQKYEYEYIDAKNMIAIRKSAKDDGIINYIQYLQYKILKSKYGLVSFS
ncbi:hypothetical protein M0R72_09575 [Candidatus Pacearchaeota archaeon]|nr:hypothetical protein [Candidatus Pacearchaeota archaeon]